MNAILGEPPPIQIAFGQGSLGTLAGKDIVALGSFPSLYIKRLRFSQTGAYQKSKCDKRG